MVLEFRHDATKNITIISSSKRSQRPTVYSEKVFCPFDKGSEKTTPPTSFALPENNWKVRCFENLYPVLKKEGEFKKGEGFWKSDAVGMHEVIVETDEHGNLFQDFPEEQLQLILEAYKNRFKFFTENNEYAFLFKNHGRGSGASIDHEHSQIIGLPFVPELIQKESDYCGKKCFFCNPGNPIFETVFFKIIAPPFARFPLEVWVVPKRHVKTFLELTEEEGKDLMNVLKKIIAKEYEKSKDYTIAFHSGFKGKDFHFHVEFYPRPNVWGGIELGTGVIINTKTEEDVKELFANV
jgi:UDPglucose--hexose-1-phosphate uridylyltransferase